MKKIVALSTIRTQLRGIVSLQLADSTASIAGNGIPGNDVASGLGEANNSSASATITITWTTAPLVDE